MSNLASQNQYHNLDIRIPRYRYARIPMNNLPSGQVTLQSTSTTLVEWKIPAATCHNLSRSFFSYNYTVPALAANYGVVFEDGFDFRWMYFGNGSGLGICDLQFSDCWVNTMRPVKTRVSKFLQNDQLMQFYPCNQATSSNIFPFSRDGLSAGTQNSSTVPNLEMQHLVFSPGLNQPLNVYRYIPLSSVVDTIFAVDKDLCYGTDMYIRAYTNLLQRMCFYTNTPDNPNANITLAPPVGTTVNMTNVYLYLAIEEDLDIRNSLLTHLSSGKISLSIPYSYIYRTSSGARSAVANTTITLTKSYGRGVKRVAFVPYNAQELTQYAYDHSNVNGTKVNTIQTTMDGRPLTDYLLNCYNPYSSIIPPNTGWNAGTSLFADDWREARKFLVNSSLLGYPMYQSMWFYQDTWGVPAGDSPDSILPQENINCYFDLLKSGDHVYSVQANTAALTSVDNNCSANGLINYLMLTFIRTLTIQPDGIILSE